MEIGDKVEWFSSGTKKQGIILEKIKPNQEPLDVILPLQQTKKYVSTYGGGKKRDHESYIVAVDGNTNKSRKKIYWPMVSQLKSAK